MNGLDIDITEGLYNISNLLYHIGFEDYSTDRVSTYHLRLKY